MKVLIRILISQHNKEPYIKAAVHAENMLHTRGNQECLSFRKVRIHYSTLRNGSRLVLDEEE